MCRRLALLVIVAVSLAASGCGASLLGQTSTVNGTYIGTFQNLAAGTSGEMTMVVASGIVNGVVVTTTPSSSVGFYTYAGTLSSNGSLSLTTGLPGSTGSILQSGPTITGTVVTNNVQTLSFTLNASTNGSLGETPFPDAYVGSFTNNAGTGNATLIIDANGNIYGVFDTNTLSLYEVTGTISPLGVTTLTGINDTYNGTLTLNSGTLTGTLRDASNNVETISMPVQQ